MELLKVITLCIGLGLAAITGIALLFLAIASTAILIVWLILQAI